MELLDHYYSNYFCNGHYSGYNSLPTMKKKGVTGSILGPSGGLASFASFGSMGNICSESRGKGDYVITGEVLVGVQYKDGQLYVHVNRARGLAAANHNGFSDPYVKTYLLPDGSKRSKKKTSVKKKTLDPVYNETLKVGAFVAHTARLIAINRHIKDLTYNFLSPFLSPPPAV